SVHHDLLRRATQAAQVRHSRWSVALTDRMRDAPGARTILPSAPRCLGVLRASSVEAFGEADAPRLAVRLVARGEFVQVSLNPVELSPDAHRFAREDVAEGGADVRAGVAVMDIGDQIPRLVPGLSQDP